MNLRTRRPFGNGCRHTAATTANDTPDALGDQQAADANRDVSLRTIIEFRNQAANALTGNWDKNRYIEKTLIFGNEASQMGGGENANQASLDITVSNFSGNSADFDGGGIYVDPHPTKP